MCLLKVFYAAFIWFINGLKLTSLSKLYKFPYISALLQNRQLPSCYSILRCQVELVFECKLGTLAPTEWQIGNSKHTERFSIYRKVTEEIDLSCYRYLCCL